MEIKGAVMSDAETNPHAAGAVASHVTRHTSHVTRHTLPGTLSWKQHGFIARAKVDKLNRQLLAKRKVTQEHLTCDPYCVTCNE